MAKNSNKKTSAERGKSTSFVIAASVLGALILVSLGLFAISSLIHGESSRKLNESLYPVKYENYVEKYSKEFGVDVCLVYGVIRTESNFDPEAVSQAGAIGLMQIMPDTFTWLQNYRTNFMPDKLLDTKELYKPQVNIEYGTYLLRYLLDHYDGDTSLAIIAYNAGYGNVDEWLANGTIPQSGVTSDVVPFPETANYLTRVTDSMEKYRELYYSDAEIPVWTKQADETVSQQTDSDITYQNDDQNNDQVYYQNDDQYTYENSDQAYEQTYPDDYSDDAAYAYEGDGTGMNYDDLEEWEIY